MKDILNQHIQICSQRNQPIVSLSLDGVQECKSTNASIDIYCVKFKQCRNIYPVRLIKRFNGYKYNEQEELQHVVSDINENEIDLETAVLDNPKRSVAKNVKSHSATHPCEYCECAAVSYIDDTMSKNQLTWPPSTMNGRPRTITGIRKNVNSIEAGDEDLTKNYLKGIKGRSVFLDQPNFDMIQDMPTEYMHLICLGIVKRMVELTYKVGKKRFRKSKLKRINPKCFNDIINSILSTREFSRRCRNLDTAVYKAQEYRNLLLVFFPIFQQNISEKFKKERQVWFTLVFMVRACVLPNEEYEHVNVATIVSASELFYNLYFELYGQQNCSYSIHVAPSHLLKIRGNVPFTERSAFAFESFYAEMKNLFKAGTSSPLKQVLKNTFMKRKLEHHVCEKSIFYKAQTKNVTMENNYSVHTFTNNKHELYIVKDINGDELTCIKQGKFVFKTNLLPNYDWQSIGVFKLGPTGNKTFKIKKNEVKGKFLNVLNILVTVPNNVLNEK